MPTHTYGASGKHTVRLTVTDNDANTSYVEKDVTSSDSGLVSRFRTKKDESSNLKMWFSGEWSHDAAGADVPYLEWSFGDGFSSTEGTPPSPAGDTYWVSTTGAASWSSAKSATPLSGTSCCSVSTANANVKAGDTVYLRAGTYSSGTYINPSASGSSSSRITIQAYGTEQVTFQNASYGILLNGKSYVTVSGIDFYSLDRFLQILNGSNYNIISDCKFDHYRTVAEWAGSKILGSSHHNRITECQFSEYGQISGTPPNGSSDGVCLEIGNEESTTDYSDYNLVEDCVLFRGGHHVLGVNSRYNVIRNNYMYHDAWMSGTGQRVLYMAGYAASSGYNLFEGNRIGYSSVGANGNITEGAQLSTSYNIFRNNALYYNDGPGIMLSCSGSYYQDVNYNHVYNNTLLSNIQTSESDPSNCAIYLGKWDGSWVIKYNTFKNNLYYLHTPHSVYGCTTSTGVILSDQTFANEYNGDVTGNPLFANATATPGDPTNEDYPDVRLKNNSPCLNAGGALTTITSTSGSGTSFVVADARYFMDGWGITGVDGDEIQVVGTTSARTITDVDYATNTITVSSSLTWTQGQGIALSYSGTYPNVGSEDEYVIAAASASYADVVNAIASATYGDTVMVPAGTATWSSQLSITKGISVIGAGSASTIITASGGVRFTPDATTRSANHLFRFSGFRLNGSPSEMFGLYNPTNNTPCRNIRLDHNIWNNGSGYPIYVYGDAWGCVDNNQFLGANFFMVLGAGSQSWNAYYPAVYGTADNLYFEDNDFAGGSNGYFGFQSGHGGRWAFRYNRVGQTEMGNPMFDQHGNQLGGICALMVCEIYENTYDTFSVQVNRWEYQRGGKLLFYNNTSTASGSDPSISINDDVADVDPVNQPQHPMDDYIWNNVWNGGRCDAVQGATQNYGGDIGIVPRENVHFFNQNDSFNGSAGMGVGLRSARPASCTLEGAGYWATDESKLYRWHSGAWELFYTPYTYPHPLRT